MATGRRKPLMKKTRLVALLVFLGSGTGLGCSGAKRADLPVTQTTSALTLAWDGWLDGAGLPPTVVADANAPSGGPVQQIARATSGGDYFSPWQTVVPGQSYCLQAAVKWVGGGAPFVGVQPAGGAVIWVMGAAGYGDGFGPVVPFNTTSTAWQQSQFTVPVPSGVTQLRLATELYAGAAKGGSNLAYFDAFSLTSGSCVTSLSVPYTEQFESGAGNWADLSGSAPSLANDSSSPAGPTVMSVTRAASGGDYFSPWIAVTGGQTYCAKTALRWAGTGGMPFVAVQVSTSPVWVIGGAGYSDAFGPVQVVSASNPGWQQFQTTLVVPESATQLRFAVELFAGAALPGANAAYFDGFSLTSGACAASSLRVPYTEQFESGAGNWADLSGSAPGLASDSSSPAGPTVMNVTRAASGGDYFSPWIAVTGGQTYCAKTALKWAGTGGMPFVAVQVSTSPIWLIGGAGYSDAFGPVQVVSASNPGWQQFQTTLAMPASATQLRFAVELYGGAALPGANAAYFDGFSLTGGACVTPTPDAGVSLDSSAPAADVATGPDAPGSGGVTASGGSTSSGGASGGTTGTGGNTGGNAPLAPTDLNIADRAAPLNVEGTPLFGWVPNDQDGNEIQSAYQIRVTRASDGLLIWDSGKVSSSVESFVAYSGPALAAGTSYTWTVRTWDRTDQVSPWAATASFDAGLGDADWQASWIRRTTSESDDYTLARRQVTVGASPVTRARAYVSAYHQYELHLNGTVVDRGPAFSYPGEGYYQATDITAQVQAGSPLAIGIIYHWYGAGQGRPAGQPGLLGRFVVEHADGSEEVIVTDANWHVRRASQWQTGAPQRNSDGGDYVEQIDSRQVPDGWDKTGYADTVSPWTVPQVVGVHPAGVFTHLTGQEPRIFRSVATPISVKTLSDGAVVADFGTVMPARPDVQFKSGVSGRTLNILTGYQLTSDGHVSTTTATTQGTNMSFKYIERAGAQEFQAFTYLGWRYLQISAPGETLSASQISAIVEHSDAPPQYAMTFSSSDATVNAVFALMQRSALYSAQQQFLDTPTRERDNSWGTQ